MIMPRKKKYGNYLDIGRYKGLRQRNKIIGKVIELKELVRKQF